MKSEKFSGVIENAYGKKLDSPISFEGEYEALESYAEAKEKNELPKEQEVVDFLNQRRKANARQKSMQAALDAAGIVRPTLENDPQLQLQGIYKSLMASGKKTHEEARQIASATLGVEWTD